MTFVQYMEVIPPLDEMDRTLRFFSVRWFISNEMDYTVAKNVLAQGVMEVGAWYGVEPSELLMGTANLVSAVPAVHLPTA